MSTDYQAYLLRLHRGQDQPHWRATLENIHSRERLRFATEQELLRYLLRLFAYIDIEVTITKDESTPHL